MNYRKCKIIFKINLLDEIQFMFQFILFVQLKTFRYTSLV